MRSRGIVRAMSRALVLAVTLAAGCHHAKPANVVDKLQPTSDADPDGPHRAAITAQVKPYVDSEIVNGIVVGIYDAGKREIYGFGRGPDPQKPPDGKTLYEIGSVTKVFTLLLLADAIQRKLVDLDTPLSELLPPGVTAPIKDKVAITLRHLALHTSGLPRIPQGLMQADPLDPYAKYNEEALYRDLVHTALTVSPGERVEYSNFGAGVLGFVLGKKLGGGYAAAVAARVIQPLGLASTFVGVPPGEVKRRAVGTDEDLATVGPWRFDALAGAGAINSDVRDQLALVEAELDAASGGTLPLRHAMKLTQEPQLDVSAGVANEGLGWQIDRRGRYWHNGATGGYHAFVGFDVKTRRGVVILASTQVTLLDHLADTLYDVLDGSAPPPAKLATAAQDAEYAGTYDLGGEKVAIVASGQRLYVEGRGEPRHRLIPISDHEFWIEALQAVAAFERADDKIARVVFVIGDKQLAATRVTE